MAQGVNNLIKKYYKKGEQDQIFNEILECCSYEIKKAIERYEIKERDKMEQEARIKIYNLLINHKLDKVIDSSDEDTSAYLKKAIDNKLKDEKKKECNCFNYECVMPFSELENISCILDEAFEFKSTFEDVFNEIIKVLTKKQKEVMRLIYLDGLKENEIAAILHVQRQDINGLKNRAKKVIRANLAQNKNGVSQTPIFEIAV